MTQDGGNGNNGSNVVPISINRHMNVGASWRKEAARVSSLDQLAELATKLVTDYQHTDGTHMDAAACLALAAINLVLSHTTGVPAPVMGDSPPDHMGVAWQVVELLGAFTPGPKNMQCIGDLLDPKNTGMYAIRSVSQEDMQWLMDMAQTRLRLGQGTNALSEPQEAHLRLIASGVPPMGHIMIQPPPPDAQAG